MQGVDNAWIILHFVVRAILLDKPRKLNLFGLRLSAVYGRPASIGYTKTAVL